MAEIIGDIGEFVSGAVTWMTSISTFIMGQDFLKLMVICVPLAGWGIGGIKRLTRV